MEGGGEGKEEGWGGGGWRVGEKVGGGGKGERREEKGGRRGGLGERWVEGRRGWGEGGWKGGGVGEKGNYTWKVLQDFNHLVFINQMW